MRQILIVRGQTDAAALLATVKVRVRTLEPNIVMADDAPLQTVLDNQLLQRRFIVQLLGVVSALALVIAISAFYAVIAYTVAQRTNEIGVRMVLGARTGDVRRMIVRQGPVWSARDF